MIVGNVSDNGIVGIIGAIVGIEEMTATDHMGITTETSRKVFATDWIGDRKIFVIEGLSIQITPAISEMGTTLIAKGSVEGTRRDTVRTITADGNRRDEKLLLVEEAASY